MKTITVKNIPEYLYELLKHNALENHRSINREIILCIERSVQSHKHENIDTVLAKARQIRSRIKAPLLTDAELNEMKTHNPSGN
ncbi:Arc family DNA-binding protein [Deltaproteobacteria bacterium TL4]